MLRAGDGLSLNFDGSQIEISLARPDWFVAEITDRILAVEGDVCPTVYAWQKMTVAADGCNYEPESPGLYGDFVTNPAYLIARAGVVVPVGSIVLMRQRPGGESSAFGPTFEFIGSGSTDTSGSGSGSGFSGSGYESGSGFGSGSGSGSGYDSGSYNDSGSMPSGWSGSWPPPPGSESGPPSGWSGSWPPPDSGSGSYPGSFSGSEPPPPSGSYDGSGSGSGSFMDSGSVGNSGSGGVTSGSGGGSGGGGSGSTGTSGSGGSGGGGTSGGIDIEVVVDVQCVNGDMVVTKRTIHIPGAYLA